MSLCVIEFHGEGLLIGRKGFWSATRAPTGVRRLAPRLGEEGGRGTGPVGRGDRDGVVDEAAIGRADDQIHHRGVIVLNGAGEDQRLRLGPCR